MKAKNVRPTIVFKGDITPMALSYLIPKGFKGNVIVTGSISSKSDNPEFFENLHVNIGGGDFYVYKNIYNVADIDVDGSLYCYGKIHNFHNVRVNGDFYVAKRFRIFNRATISGDFTAESDVTIFIGAHLSTLGNFESKVLFIDNIEARIHIRGAINVPGGFHLKLINP